MMARNLEWPLSYALGTRGKSWGFLELSRMEDPFCFPPTDYTLFYYRHGVVLDV